MQPALLAALRTGVAGLAVLAAAAFAAQKLSRRRLRRSRPLQAALRKDGSSDSVGPIADGDEDGGCSPLRGVSPESARIFRSGTSFETGESRRAAGVGVDGLSHGSRSRSTRWPASSSGTPLVVISDAGQDLDDEMSIVMMRYLVSRGQVNVRGIIATLAPAFDRALLIRGTLDMLGMHDVPVGIGSDGGSVEHEDIKIRAAYVPPRFSEGALALEPGRELLRRLMQEAAAGPAEDKLTLLLIASTKDAAIMLRDHEELFVRAVQEVVIMGGCVEGAWVHSPQARPSAGQDGASGTAEPSELTPWYMRGGGKWRTASPEELKRESERNGAPGAILRKDTLSMLEPDSAHNNQFDAAAARFIYRRCQELGVRLVILSRWAAYACKVPRSLYDEMATHGSCIGWRLRNEQRSKLEALWARSNATDPAGRQGLPARCTSEWFLSTFCSAKGAELGKTRGADDSIWDLVDGFMQYDTVALIAAIPDLRRKYMDPIHVAGPHGVSHLVVGLSPQEPGMIDGASLAAEMHHGFAEGIGCNLRGLRKCEHVILLMRVNKDTLVDVKLCCVMLRALWSLGVTECLGILVEVDRDDESELAGWSASIRSTLSLLGLSHVPVRPVYDQSAARRNRSSSLSGTTEYAAIAAAAALRQMLKRRCSGSRLQNDSLPGDSHHGGSPPADGSTSPPGSPEPKRTSSAHAPRRTAPGAAEVSGRAARPYPQSAAEQFSAAGVSGAEPVLSVLVELYGIAPPWGLVLVCSSGLSSVCRFAETHTTLFRERTTRVVHMGGADLKRAGANGTNLEMLDAARARAADEPASHGGAAGARSVLGCRIHPASSCTPPPPVRQTSEPDMKALRPRPYELHPDSEATNNSVDMAGARRLYELSQNLSVPLVVLSRHVAVSSRVPRQLFDVLAGHGGTVGRAMCNEQQRCLRSLWEHVRLPAGHALRELPSRCDEGWFRRQFIDKEAEDDSASGDGRATSVHFRASQDDDRSSPASAASGRSSTLAPVDMGRWPGGIGGADELDLSTIAARERAAAAVPAADSVATSEGAAGVASAEVTAGRTGFEWENTRWVTIYSPLALLAAHPVAMEKLFVATAVRVRSATHHVIGVSAANPGTGTHALEAKLRACLCQGLFSGCRQNASEYDLDFPGQMPIGHGKCWTFEKEDETLREVLLGDDMASACGHRASPETGRASLCPVRD